MLPEPFNDEDIQQFLSAFEDFMKHAEVEELYHEIRTPRHTVILDGLEVEIPEENDLINSFEKEAAKHEVTVDYYMAEFLWIIKNEWFLQRCKLTIYSH